MATITDYFTRASSGTRPVPTTTTATVASGSSPGTITCAALTGWPTTTPVHFVIYTTDANGNKVAGSQIDCKGIVVSNTITGTIVKAGTNLGFSVGAIVEAAPTAAWADDVATGLAVSHNQDGSLTASSVQTALGLSSSVGAGWTPLAQTFTYGANNGNKEFTVTATADLSATLSPGMRMQLTRGTTAPTQSMAFTAASSQYASKTSPTGLSFTTAYTCEAWVYLTAYSNTGGDKYTIITRRNAAVEGWGLRLTNAGQVETFYGTASNFTVAQSYQSVPLNRWVHVAATATAATKAVATYINGVSVSNTQTSSAATSFTQNGNLNVGWGVGVGEYFNGYLSEVRTWSVVQTQSQIQANMGINLVGNEANLVALFKGNGNFTDTTANANTLTASGGAIATQAANPYNNVEYSIITKVSYSNPTTTLTLFGGTDYNIPNMTLSSPQYSALKSPVGFNSARYRWSVQTINRNQVSQGSPAQNTWYNLGSLQLAVPTGEWMLGYSGSFYGDRAATGTSWSAAATLSTSSSSASDGRFSNSVGSFLGSNQTLGGNGQLSALVGVALTSQTPYYLLERTTDASMASLIVLFNSNSLETTITAECAWI